MDDVYERVRDHAERLQRNYNLRSVRMLGWGGQGAVALFDTRFKPSPTDDYIYSFFAIKFPLGDDAVTDRRFRREKRKMAVRSFSSPSSFAGTRY